MQKIRPGENPRRISFLSLHSLFQPLGDLDGALGLMSDGFLHVFFHVSVLVHRDAGSVGIASARKNGGSV